MTEQENKWRSNLQGREYAYFCPGSELFLSEEPIPRTDTEVILKASGVPTPASRLRVRT